MIDLSRSIVLTVLDWLSLPGGAARLSRQGQTKITGVTVSLPIPTRRL